MRTGRYSIAELFGNRHIEQLVIPEIQRDYVWKAEQVQGLLDSILKNFNDWKQAKGTPRFKVVPEEPQDIEKHPSLENDFTAFYAQRYHGTNIGFVYAYSDGDLPGQYYLIDGQQRLTTLYLVLLAVASRNDDLKERFRARYCLQSTDANPGAKAIPTKLDYRLREHITDFFHHCVPYLLENPEHAETLQQQSWYRKRLDEDKTVKNLINNFTKIYSHLENELDSDCSDDAFKYLDDLVDCWYFDTNESVQGEELYIYLNARGESTATNENKKAELLKSLSDEKKEDWGKKWEEWQDFFWQKRRKGLEDKHNNPNADRGFNSFLACIKNLEKLKNKGGNECEETSLEVIEKYLSALKWLGDNKGSFKKLYSYSGWVDSWFNEIWSVFNNPAMTDWDANFKDDKKPTERNKMVLIWGSLLSIFSYFERNDWEPVRINIDDIERIFRTIRIFWLRYKNYNRSVASLPAAVKDILFNDSPEFIGSESKEEALKWNLLKNTGDEERRHFEAVIWEIEDHPFNIDGRDLDNQNISHLVDLNEQLTLETLNNVKETFYRLFPKDNKKQEERTIAQILLYYGEFWHHISPWYHKNYDFSDWRRTIRGKGNVEQNVAASTTVFRLFFQDFMKKNKSPNEFLKMKQDEWPESIDPVSETSLRKALIWYSQKLQDNFLKEGMYVVIDRPQYEESDANFPKLSPIWNTSGSFKGRNKKMSEQKENG
ncbi:DUF262 domain-containing protein [Desulfosudis oleivorans]|uniref:GmrSD restriction endonucleases N-terminal domain-containing protein n=1 Tax=Desulfosudis oleivorans (strain DSM 6200 / JCM 39069 / Hxd3) TaxID=96561 RepID=A8ZS39_DESOH|nr:DUF262 domain-containing protein [Desulfosudis oleivorans]ABW66057.1 protein of unknown function DUF262 [Desulfosudis oleivorans Hxd3]